LPNLVTLLRIQALALGLSLRALPPKVEGKRDIALARAAAAAEQGDQIGQIFAQWEIVYIRQFYKYYRSSLKFWLTFFLSIDHVLILIKEWSGYVSGDFFTNSSGRPAAECC
jgi:hypothetical protein